MKLFLRILINFFLAGSLLFFLATSVGFIGVQKNFTLVFLTFAVLFTYNVKTTEKFTHKTKGITILILILLCAGYIIVPKKNTACQAPLGGIGCTSHQCIGIPISDFSPHCLGKSFGEKTTWTPDNNVKQQP